MDVDVTLILCLASSKRRTLELSRRNLVGDVMNRDVPVSDLGSSVDVVNRKE